MNSGKKILIVDDDIDLLRVLEQRCLQLGLDVVTTDNAMDALNVAITARPNVICMDVELPKGNGLAACEMFISDERFSTTPLVVVTGKSDHDIERRCNQLPAYFIPKCADTWSRLEPLLRELFDLPPLAAPLDSAESSANVLRPVNLLEPSSAENQRPPSSAVRPSQPTENPAEALLDTVFQMMAADASLLAELSPAPRPWVLCIDDDRDFSTALSHRLEGQGVGVINAYDGTDGYRKAFLSRASAIILDYNMPNGQGDYVLRRLKEMPMTKDIPVIVLTGNKNSSVRRTMLNLGAVAFLHKPFVFADLLAELRLHIPECMASG